MHSFILLAFMQKLNSLTFAFIPPFRVGVLSIGWKRRRTPSWTSPCPSPPTSSLLQVQRCIKYRTSTCLSFLDWLKSYLGRNLFVFFIRNFFVFFTRNLFVFFTRNFFVFFILNFFVFFILNFFVFFTLNFLSSSYETYSFSSYETLFFFSSQVWTAETVVDRRISKTGNTENLPLHTHGTNLCTTG